MFDSRKKIGFVLATIHTGSSLPLWRSLANKVYRENGTLFIFPGGKLNKQTGSDYLRNHIYSLANKSNLDGVISWASSIGGGDVSLPELETFHEQFAELPFVTLGQKIGTHPYVKFDAYSGMKELVRHFVKVHGARRIAFVRGPENHTSAEERFRAYQDVMREEGLDTEENQKLISGCVSWYCGEQGIIQLCEERGLVPGKDFDALIASSDMMAFACEKWLRKRGYQIPKHLLLGGFNDTVESRISSPSYTTVHMPVVEMGLEAYELLQKRMESPADEKGEQADSFLATYPVIRESCGCNNIKLWNSPLISKVKIQNKAQFLSEIEKLFNSRIRKTANFEGIVDALFENDKAEFFKLIKAFLTEYFEQDGELSNLFNVIKVFRSSNCLPVEYVERIIRTLNILIPQIQGRVASNKQYENKRIGSVISTLKTELLSIHTRVDLIKTLHNRLSQVDINKVAVVLTEDENKSRYIGGFNPLDDLYTEEVLFPRGMLVPDFCMNEYAQGVYVVQPLFLENKNLGYVVANYTDCEGSVYEDLRNSIGNALQSILLFEQIEKEKKLAERAEFEKTEFFANVGSDLCDPLKDLSSKVSQMESNIENGILDSDILAEQLLFLRSQIESQINKTETLVDLTRSQVDDLPMDKKLFDIRQVLPANIASDFEEELPLLYGDSERIKKSLQIIFTFGGKNVSIKADLYGINIHLNIPVNEWQKPEMLLAEKIILLQYGEINRNDEYVSILIPWPNLAGQPPLKNKIDDKQIYSLSGKEKYDSLFNVPLVSSEILPENSKTTSVLFWMPDDAPIDEWVKVYGMRRNDELFKAPLLCYSHNMIGHNFMEMLEQKIRAQKVAPVLFVNAKHTHYGTWATDSNSVSIPSMQEFEKILTEITPSLIVFEKIDEETIKKIRQNQKTVLVPIIVLPDIITSAEEVDMLCSHPRIILCNRGAAESEQFNKRIHEILSGEEILPPHTGTLVKRAILYLNTHASQQIVRWKLADSVHVSEDYLTRIFHKEIGLSLWEYLNRYRIYLATKMLLETNDTIYEIAENSGFQDQAYFCRVFKKIYGVPPGKIRSK
ncbi:substrate-binding domain-containing protein [Treponema zioleckii]|uniref:substrate-binding domain-containing protein n=1 Tax=Treponema zioleckii TaxID=331680 RepID=UPI00168B11F3|nr:substrate-binding domain-containing protein [Treponema zioleckii]